MTLDKIIDKIRKLHALKSSSNVHEAANAAALAAELMQRYQIEEASIEVPVETEEPVGMGHTLHESKRLQAWRSSVAGGVAAATGCKVYIARGGIKLMGRKSDADAARYLFTLICSEIDRLADLEYQHAVPPSYGNRGFGTAWKSSFRIGAATVVRARLVEQSTAKMTEVKTQAAAGDAGMSRAMVVLDKRAMALQDLSRKFLRGTHRGGGTISQGGAFAAGQAAGRGIDLNRSGRAGLPAPQKMFNR